MSFFPLPQALGLAITALALLKKVPEAVRALHQHMKLEFTVVIDKAVIVVEDSTAAAAAAQRPSAAAAATLLSPHGSAANAGEVKRSVSAILPRYCDTLFEK